MTERGFELITQAFGLTALQQRLFLRIGWVVIVSIHIAWVCGWLAVFGAAAPFAKASDVEQIKAASIVSARQALVIEIRAQTRVMCSTGYQEGNGQLRDALLRSIDKLREEYRIITGERAEPVRCDS